MRGQKRRRRRRGRKNNEITAIPKLLDIIDVEGANVTIDAGVSRLRATQVAKRQLRRKSWENKPAIASRSNKTTPICTTM